MSLQPPAFWDNLQNISMTSSALKEAARRYYQPPLPKELCPDISWSAAKIVASYPPRELQKLKRFARQGGPGFSDLRYCSLKTPIPSMASGNCYATSRVTTHASEFLTKLKESHVYPAGYRLPEGGEMEPPANFTTIVDMLSHDRPSLPQITKKDFEDFKRAWKDIATEQVDRDLEEYFAEVLEGGDSEDSKCENGFLFANFAILAKDVGHMVPYHVAGAHREALDSNICARLNKEIQPSNSHHLIAPNFFLELYATPDAKPTTARKRACYAGALGARAMQALRRYEKEEEQPLFDHKAYTLSATLHSGMLNLYAHHITDGDPQNYITTEIAEYNMRSGQDEFQIGITAYRNARDWAKNRRNELIAGANSRHPQGSGQQTAGSHVGAQKSAPGRERKSGRKSGAGKKAKRARRR
ncbi:uncharacterized protein KD926_008283 [Aspergillus affinis]|uniref:uncharacterized protein n=1 Tax=Aspergillus affinis TaxID=1070780 RepID=UPI0022FDEBA0|nr:uncharacterized protein KD926_008283 [Aspergillus affinis]KAI9040460.1 hypothetical protein KD926_008283 [Aspergillus affinis]